MDTTFQVQTGDNNILTLRLRRATNADCKAVQQLVFGCLAEFNLRPDPSSTDSDIADIEHNYFASGGLFEVLENVDSPGEIVASYGIYNLDHTHNGNGSPVTPVRGQKECELRKMYMVKSLRGKGLGKMLLTRAVEQARAAGFTIMELETASVLEPAVALYKKFGFKPMNKPAKCCSARCDAAFYMEL